LTKCDLDSGEKYVNSSWFWRTLAHCMELLAIIEGLSDEIVKKQPTEICADTKFNLKKNEAS
jgi:hypothetical protein